MQFFATGQWRVPSRNGMLPGLDDGRLKQRAHVSTIAVRKPSRFCESKRQPGATGLDRHLHVKRTGNQPLLNPEVRRGRDLQLLAVQTNASRHHSVQNEPAGLWRADFHDAIPREPAILVDTLGLPAHLIENPWQ